MATTLLRLVSSTFRPTLAFRPFSAAASLPNSRRNNQTELKNGLRVVTEETGGQTVGVCVTLDVGSRLETEDCSGVTSLWLQSVLDGANAAALASSGARLTGGVERDRTWLAVHCLSRDLKPALQELARLVAAQQPHDLEGSRRRLLARMAAEDSDPKVVVMNSLYSMAFQNTGLALPPIGRSHVVSALNKDHIGKHLSLHVKGPRAVVSVVGDVDHNECVRSVEQLFSSLSPVYDNSEVPTALRARFSGSDIRIRDDAMPLASVAIAVEGAPAHSENAIVLSLATELMGRWDRTFGGGADVSSYLGLSSAAAQLTHSFEAFDHSFGDSGLFGVYLVTERMKQEDVMWHLLHEWKRFCAEVTDNELARAKNSLVSLAAKRDQNPLRAAKHVGAQLLLTNRSEPFAEWRQRVLNVDALKFRDVLTEHVWDRCPAVAALGPIEQLEDYELLRSKFSWMRY